MGVEAYSTIECVLVSEVKESKGCKLWKMLGLHTNGRLSTKTPETRIQWGHDPIGGGKGGVCE
jgi:hypothetical protein